MCSQCPFYLLLVVNNSSSIPPVQRWFFWTSGLFWSFYCLFFVLETRHFLLHASEENTAFLPKIVPLSQPVQLHNPPWRWGIEQQSSGTNIRIIMPQFQGGSNHKLFTDPLFLLFHPSDQIKLMTNIIIDGEWQERNGKRNKKKTDRASQGLWGSWKHKTPPVKTFILSLWSEEDAKILQAHKREWLTKTFSSFYEKMPERHVNPTFIKGHLSGLYDA